jgi:hypothetical protein
MYSTSKMFFFLCSVMSAVPVSSKNSLGRLDDFRYRIAL